MDLHGVEGHYRPVGAPPPRRFGVSGFVKGPTLSNVRDDDHESGDEEEEEGWDCFSKRKGGSTGKRRQGGSIKVEEDEEPSELYSRLVASSSSSSTAPHTLHRNQAKKTAKRPRTTHDPDIINSFTCQVCDIVITSVNQAEHERSTLHIFNQKKANTARKIVLPDSNRGVQILSRLGWSGETGLGIEEQGRIEPAKSTLKLDTKGLGQQQPKARVTHFPPHIPQEHGKSAAERAVDELEKRKQEEKKAQQVLVGKGVEGRGESRKDRRKREAKEKWQRDKIRRALNTDLPEGYEEYFR